MYINSTELINLGTYTKSLINDGVYYLFKASNIDNIEYVLKTDDVMFMFLNKEGEIISSEKSISKDKIGEYVYFGDMPVSKTGISLNLSIA